MQLLQDLAEGTHDLYVTVLCRYTAFLRAQKTLSSPGPSKLYLQLRIFRTPQEPLGFFSQ